jgi:hypothetical protein
MAIINDYQQQKRVVEFNGELCCIQVAAENHDGDDCFCIAVYEQNPNLYTMFTRNKSQVIDGLEESELRTLRDCINAMLREPAPKATPPAAAVDLKKASVINLYDTVYFRGNEISSGVLQKGDEFSFYKSDVSYRVVSDPFDGPAGQKAAWIVPLVTQPTLLEDDGEID